MAADLEGAVVRAARVVADDILIAYYEDEQRRRIVQLLLDAMPTQRSAADGLTLLQMRDALAVASIVAAASGSDEAAEAEATALQLPPPPFTELDAHLRAFVSHRWVVAWVDPVTQIEHFWAPVQAVIDAFRESARAEVDVYEQRTAPDAGGCLFQCTQCGATRALLDVLGCYRSVASSASAAATMSGSLAPSFCTTCTQVGTVVELGPPSREDATRVCHVLRPLLRHLDELERACADADTAALAHAHAVRREAPTLTRARFVRVANRRGTRARRDGDPATAATPELPGRQELNCDVYIGADRSARDERLRSTRWTLPPGVGLVGAPSERALAEYEAEVRQTPALMRALPALSGKRLGCSCAYTRPGGKHECHGQVLIRLWREAVAAAAATAAAAASVGGGAGTRK